jgi:hypothetical protein
LDIEPGGVVVIFAKKQEKIWKKIISERNNFEKKEKSLGVGQKYEISYA